MITVLLPTYNAGGTIKYAIQSILEQTFSEFELLILDDGSTDSTANIVKSFSDSRITFVQFSHHGLSKTLNEGLRLAQFDIIARMDADDISMPSRLYDEYELLKTKGSSCIVSCDYAIFHHGAIQYHVTGSKYSNDIKKRLALHPDIPHPGVMFYKQFIVDSGMYRDVPLEDYDLWLRIKEIAQFEILNKTLVLVGHVPSSLTNRDIPNRNKHHYDLQEPYFTDLKKEFGFNNPKEGLMIRGWREYFYGNRLFARRNWKELGFIICLHPRIVLAYLLTYFPDSILVKIKEKRIKQRFLYFAFYFKNNSIEARKVLKKYYI